MVDKHKMCRHMPERVLRKHDYVHTIPRPPTTIGPLESADVVVDFTDFVVHVLSQQERGDPVPEDEVWKHSVGYVKWFYCVSHPIMIAPTAHPDYTTLVPPYEEVIIEQQWARQPPNPFQIIQNRRAIVYNAAGVLDVYSNPVVVGIMESIQQ